MQHAPNIVRRFGNPRYKIAGSSVYNLSNSAVRAIGGGGGGVAIRWLRLDGVDPELVEDDEILDNGAQGPEKPGNSLDDVRGLLRVADDAEAIREVAREGQ